MISCLRLFVFFIWTLCGAGAAWWKFGFFYGFLAFSILAGISIYFASKASDNPKDITNIDIGLPIIVSIFCAILFAPVALFAANFFSIATCIGSGILLSICLWRYRAGGMCEFFLMLPFATFVYECLPIDLPTDIDNILGLGANGVNLFLSNIVRPSLSTQTKFDDHEIDLLDND